MSSMPEVFMALIIFVAVWRRLGGLRGRAMTVRATMILMPFIALPIWARCSSTDTEQLIEVWLQRTAFVSLCTLMVFDLVKTGWLSSSRSKAANLLFDLLIGAAFLAMSMILLGWGFAGFFPGTDIFLNL